METPTTEYLVICESKNDVTYFFHEICEYAYRRRIRIIRDVSGYTIYFLQKDVKVRFVSRYIYELFARIGFRGTIVKDEVVREFIKKIKKELEERNGASI